MKQNVEIDSAASSGGQGKYMKYFSFQWDSTWGSTVSSLSYIFVLKEQFFKELTKTNDRAMSVET